MLVPQRSRVVYQLIAGVSILSLAARHGAGYTALAEQESDYSDVSKEQQGRHAANKQRDYHATNIKQRKHPPLHSALRKTRSNATNLPVGHLKAPRKRSGLIAMVEKQIPIEIQEYARAGFSDCCRAKGFDDDCRSFMCRWEAGKNTGKYGY